MLINLTEYFKKIATIKPPKEVIYFFCFIIMTLCSTVPVFSQDLDTGYKFGTVKPPDSPIQNTWSAFHTDLFTGSFGYEYKIEVLPGVNGLAPEVKLSYNSHSASGKAGWVGAGWDIPLNYIQRDIEYTRKDTSDDTFDLFLSGTKHDLVYVPSETRYHTQIETYHRIEKLTGAPNNSGEYWRVTAKDGTQYRFGYNPDSEHLVNATDGNVPRYVWRWSLDQIQDTNGNKIYFSYTEDRGAVYLRQIAYNNDQERRVDFVLEASDRPDNYLMIDQGSEVRIARRLREILVVVRNGLARKYLLGYALNNAQTKSLLTTITQYGADNVTALPPVRFAYHAMNPSFGPETSWAAPGERYIRKVDGFDTVVDTFDANGDGLPDLVSHDTNDYPHWDIWFNTRSGFAAANVKWAVPDGWMIRDVIPKLLDDDQSDGGDSPDTRTSPMDFNRDGYIDFLKAHGEKVLSIRLNNGNGFSSAVDWSLPTYASIQEVQLPKDVAPNVKQEFFDINGDGLPDLVKRENSGTGWHVWRNTGSGFVDFGVWPVPNPNAWVWDTTRGESNLQAGHYDMNGDGLPDIVNGHRSDWLVHFNTGSNFLPGEVWPTGYSGGLIRDADTTGNVKRDLFDINGDDLPDNIDPQPGTDVWQVRLNNGHGFGPLIAWPTNSGLLEFTRDVTRDGNIVRDTIDMDGDGLVDLVRKTDNDWKVYFNRAGQADLLTHITDTLGGKVEITYGPSMAYPQRQQIYPPPYPASRLPFNFWVVTAVTKDNGMSGAHAVRATTNYNYHGGQYDFPSREFRGFGWVEEYRPNLASANDIYFGQLQIGQVQDNCIKGKQLRNGIRWMDGQKSEYLIKDNAFSCSVEHDNVYSSQIVSTSETMSEVV